MENNEVDLSELIELLLQRPIAFNRAFASVAGGACQGLFLSQAWFWSKRSTIPGGWFYKTQEEWEEETALTRYEQESARKSLRQLGILEERKSGIPAKLYYRINHASLQTRLLETNKQGSGKTTRKRAGKPRTIPETTTETTTEKKEEIPLISPMGKLCKNDCDGIEGIDNQAITTTLEATSRGRLQPQGRLVVEEESPENDPLPFPTSNTIPTAKQDPSPPPSRRRRTGPSPELLADADEVLAHLCEVTGKQFRVHGEIATILRKGYTKAQCLLVIDWLHIVRRNRSKMDKEWVEQRLGITTPFYEKNFAGYLADAELWEQHKDSPSHDHTATRTRFMDFYANGTR